MRNLLTKRFALVIETLESPLAALHSSYYVNSIFGGQVEALQSALDKKELWKKKYDPYWYQSSSEDLPEFDSQTSQSDAQSFSRPKCMRFSVEEKEHTESIKTPGFGGKDDRLKLISITNG